MAQTSGYTRISDYFSLFMIFLCVLCLAFSTAGLEITNYLAVLSFLLGGSYLQKWKFIKSSTNAPFILSAIILYLILILGCTYSSAISHEILRNLSAYEKLLLVPVILWTLNQFPKFKKPFLGVLFFGILFNFVLGFFKFHNFWPSSDQVIMFGHPTADLGTTSHIALSYFASITIFFFGTILIHQFKTLSLVQKSGCLLGLFISLYYLFFLTIGRSGLITLAILILYGIFRAVINFKAYKLTLFIVIISAASLLIAHQYSPIFTQNLERGSSDLVLYKNGNGDSSWGIRLNFWKNSLKLIQHKPILGYGTGSMRAEYLTLDTTHDPNFMATPNPHDQYLFFMVENGIPGLLGFLAFMYFAQKTRISLSNLNSQTNSQILKLLLEGSVLAFAIGCLYNSWLHDVHEGLFSIMLFAGLRSLYSVQEPEVKN